MAPCLYLKGRAEPTLPNKLTFNSIIIPMHMKRVKSELANDASLR